MTPQQLLRILWSRRVLALSVFCTIVGVVLLVSLVMPKTYVAETSIVVDFRGHDPVTGAVQDVYPYADYIATQADVIASHNVALKVVDRLKLADDSDARQRFLEDTRGAGSIRDWLADALLKSLDVLPARTGSVIAVKFASHNARYSADVANAFADGYMTTALELTVEPAKRQAAWFQDQVQLLRKNLEVSKARLSDYQSAQGIVGATERIDVEQARLGDLSTQLSTAQAALADSESRNRQIATATDAQKLEQLPDLLGNSLLQGMKADLGRAEGKLAEVSERYGPNHPDYQSALAEVTSLKRKIAGELATVTGSIQQAAQIAAQRVKDVQAALDAQKARILDLKQQQNQYDVITRDVESAQHAYDAALQRTTEVRLQSQMNQTSVAVLNAAVPPLKPARPKLLQNLLMASVLGALVGIFTALFSELHDRRVRTEEDLTSVVGLPLLGVLPKLRSTSVTAG